MPVLCEVCQCNGCSACANICPKRCISMEPDVEGFWRPMVDTAQCIACGLCEKVCPVLNPPNLPEGDPDCFAAINIDDQERLQASSGGLFILLARWVIENRGAVFGAAFNSDFSVSHKCAETEPEVSAFCTSKYVQSEIGSTYQEAKALLDQGRYVLFSGTPCQILGLRCYLGKNYEKLFTVDIICHGVPSPAVWRRYVQERAQKDADGRLPVNINFRAKEDSWSKFSMLFAYEREEYCVPHRDDSYMRGFLRNLYLRPSCHQCIAKNTHRVSDITLADFWGIRHICPEMNDDQGTSLVLLHTKRAKTIWTDISRTIKYMPVDLDNAIGWNSAAIQSVDCHPNRTVFFEYFPTCEDLSALILKLTPDSKSNIRTFYRRIMSKVAGLFTRKQS